MNSCSSCKHHSFSQRPKLLGIVDGDLEMIEEDDTTLEDVYTCTSVSMPKGSFVVGLGAAEERGEKCPHYTNGAKLSLSPHLLRLLAQSEERAAVTKKD